MAWATRWVDCAAEHSVGFGGKFWRAEENHFHTGLTADRRTGGLPVYCSAWRHSASQGCHSAWPSALSVGANWKRYAHLQRLLQMLSNGRANGNTA